MFLYGQGCITSLRVPTDEVRAQKHNAALNKCLDYGSPSTYKIVNLLYRHDYNALDKWFENMQQQYRQDAQYECYLDEAYAIFDQRNMQLKDLDAWVYATGSSYAYVARGAYKVKQGFGARGGKFFNQTSPSQINEMQRYHEAAARDLQTAISKNKSLMTAYRLLIQMAKSSDMPYTAQQILQKAEENDKQSFSLRNAYMSTLQPSWGGSLEKMAEFANRESQFADENPRLWSLQGEAIATRGFTLHRKDDCASAVELYNVSLKYGDNPRWLRMRSLCYSSLGQKELAKADLDKFRYYVSRDATGSVPGEPADVAGLTFEAKEKTTIDPLMSRNTIRSYFVLPIEQLTPYPDDLADAGQRDSKRHVDKIELMIMRLGSECVDRTNMNSILDERKILLTRINYLYTQPVGQPNGTYAARDAVNSQQNANAQTVGQLMGADAVIIAMNSQNVNHNGGKYSAGIYIKAISVSTGRVLWESLLTGSVVVNESLTNLHELIYDTLEAKLYNTLEDKLQKEIKQ